MNFVRLTAGRFGAALASTFWERRSALHHSQLVEHLTACAPRASESAARLESLGIGGQPALAQINDVVTQQASALAAIDIFWISGWLFLLLIGFVWLTRKPLGAAPTAGH